MLNIAPLDVTILSCFATPAALDALATVPDTSSVRVAPDELWVLAAPRVDARVPAAVRLELERLDAAALVVDQSDGWTLWQVSGLAADEVLIRLMAAPPPDRRPAFIQGAIAGVPGKVIVRHRALSVMVPSPVGHHFCDRVFEACADLTPTLGGRISFLADAEPAVLVGALGAAS